MQAIKRTYRNVLPVTIRRPLHLFRINTFGYWKTLQGSLSDPYVRQMKQRLQTLKGKYTGQRCFIMGTGPSLNQMDLTLLQNEYVWGVNQCDLLFERISWRPSFYTWHDPKGIEINFHDRANKILKETNNLIGFFPTKLWPYVESSDKAYWYQDKYVSFYQKRGLPYSVFSNDIAKQVTALGTIIFIALQLAGYLGFSTIYLIGCDATDQGHFDPRYTQSFGRPLDHMAFSYQQADEAGKSLGFKVYNATVGGQSPVFPRVNYNDLF